MNLPRLYAIADYDLLTQRGSSLMAFAGQIASGGAALLQLRYKTGEPQQVLRAAATLQVAFPGILILNDRADLAVLAGFGGVHVGQADLSPEEARWVVGAGRWVGVSTHMEEQMRLADAGCADYVAVGPVFATGTKLDAEAVIGLDGVRRARALTGKPMVAIGGITRQNARSVIEAGADSVAIISGLLVQGETVEKVARDFLEILG